ncbi:MAG: endonuclease III [Rickettsiaceae bacterium]|nr:endonuclease III [Rickettsiaceae bacterium]
MTILSDIQIENIFKYFAHHYPDPKTELNYVNNFTLTVAVILSAQATDISVNKATKLLFEKYTTPEAFLALGEERLKEYIKSIGLYHNKAKNIINLCKILVDDYNSQIPDNFASLISLPGIGSKTANVILNCAFLKPTIAVDTHVFRVAHRLALTNAKTPEKVSKALVKIVPEKWLIYAHHWLILHGRYICKARKPLCDQCGIRDICEYYKKIKQ